MNVCLIDVLGDGVIKTFIHKGIVTGVSFLESVRLNFHNLTNILIIIYIRLWMNFLFPVV